MGRGAAVELLLWAIAGAAFGASAWVGRPATDGAGRAVEGADGIASALAGNRSARAQLGVLRAITWNVGGTRDGRPHPFDHGDLDRLAGLLAEHQPDLLLLQEFRYGMDWPALRGRLREEGPFIKASGDVAIVALRGELHGGELVGNVALAEWRIDERTIAVGNVHASAWNARERRRLIGGAVDRLFAAPGQARLFGGDLNLDVGQRSDLFSGDPESDVAIYNWVAARLTDVGAAAGPTAEPDRRLDYLFTSPELRTLHARVLPDRRGPTMDHDPLELLLVPR